MADVERFSPGDWVVVIDPKFYQEEHLEPDTKFQVSNVENPDEYPLGPGCLEWNRQNVTAGWGGRSIKQLNNECGRIAAGLVCLCKEFRDQCGQHQRVHIEVPEEQIFEGSPSGYGISGKDLQKTTPPQTEGEKQ